MCIKEDLPRFDLKDRLLHNLNDVNNPAEDLPDDANILEAALNGTPLDGDFLTHEARNLGGDDEPQHQRPWEAYEEIFTHDTGIARREDRPSMPPTLDVHVFVNRWYELVKTEHDPEHELGPPPEGFFIEFVDLVRNHLPKKLDLDSWVGSMVMGKLSDDKYIKKGATFQWRSWMGTNEERSTPPPAGYEFLEGYLGFVGTPGEGRLVWRKDQWGVLKNPSETEKKKYKMIEWELHGAEDNLVRLSIRIANYLAYWLVCWYAHPLMHTNDGVDRERLVADHIPEAVIEILGHEWFELPFDHEGKLKSWKHKRDMRISEDHFVHIIRP